MKSNRIIWGLVSLVVLTTIAVSFGTMSSYSQKDTAKPSPTAQPNIQIEDIKKDFPSIEYANDRVIDEARKLKSQKYDKYPDLDRDITEDNTVVSTAHWFDNIKSPLPISESEIVVLGKVATTEAYLSQNKRSVYSEVKIEIEKVFKNSCNDKLEDEKYLRAEREGGIVVFPSGKKIWLLVSGQRMPKVGSRYLFFLTHEFPSFGYRKQDLFLLTGYELKDGRVFPLDNPYGGTSPITTFYKGKDESVLLNDLQKLIENPIPPK